MTVWLIAGEWLVAFFWLAGAANAWRSARAMPRLPPLAEARTRSLRVSIIVAARNEAQHVEEAVIRLLAQRGVETELIVVDDRSTDATGAILDRLAGAQPRLRVEHVRDLPPGWLGKCHALHRAALRATGDWLLFLDADAHLSDDAVARALVGALDHGVAHVSCLFGPARGTLAARAAMTTFMTTFIDRIGKVNRDRRRAFVGVGAFNMVRADVYRAFGGHETIRLEIIDDLAIGLCVRKIGERTRVFWAVRDVEVDYAPTLPQFLRNLEKNGFAAFRFSVLFLAGGVALLMTLWLAAALGPLFTWWTGSLSGVVAFAGLMLSCAPGVMVAAERGRSPAGALLGPLCFPFMMAAFVRSAALTLARGGVRWRGTFYPLKDLRAALLSWRIPDESIRRAPSAPGPPAPSPP